jgi:hypothetical protein
VVRYIMFKNDICALKRCKNAMVTIIAGPPGNFYRGSLDLGLQTLHIGRQEG